ncbi:phage holin family protein [Radiobacillus kanasensis]|uniref:phage holin family protein n=1 Tax=Radiobacillus kanasensis TaxID=2844358 RepID=UPI001E4DB3ED|nr:phage holin family protein [Radiobacillus kanasensis]UFU00376.1 phage holin family protein [Radiobacillus kanasensis]
MENLFKILIASGGTIVSYLFGGWSTLLQILMVFIVIDYLTGLMAGWGKWNSKVGFKGIAKKVMILVLVAVGHAVDTVLGGDSHFIRDAVIFFYLANESLSIIENAGRTGLPIPNVLKKAVETLSEKSESEVKKKVK